MKLAKRQRAISMVIFKTALLAVVGAALLLTMAGCGGGSQTDAEGNVTYSIRLTTISGTQTYSGTIMVTRADGQIETSDVEGVAPRTYTVKGVQVDLVFSKESSMGYLKVELLNGRTVVAEGDTSAAFGTIWVTGR